MLPSLLPILTLPHGGQSFPNRLTGLLIVPLINGVMLPGARFTASKTQSDVECPDYLQLLPADLQILFQHLVLLLG